MLFTAASEGFHSSSIEALPLGRSNIVDRNGVIVATAVFTASLFANPGEIINVEEAAYKISKALPSVDRRDLLSKLQSKRSFVWVQRNLTPHEQKKVHNLGIPGIHFQREERRVYPHGSLFSHILGYTDIDNHGLTGVEKEFDETLRRSNQSLELSLDIRFQNILREELSKGIKDFKALGGNGIIFDAQTSEVLAMVTLPDFDPNHIEERSSKTIFNTNTLGVYEMGSLYKIFTLAMALDSGKVTLDSGYDASKPLKIGRFYIDDYYGQKRWLSVPEIFMYSSNIGTAKMALDVGTEGQQSFLKKIGLLDPLDLEIPEQGSPLFPSNWRDAHTMTISYGYGLAITPVHLVNAVAAMINGGIYRKPTILKKNKLEKGQETRVISQKTSKTIQKLMYLSVQQGTGKKANLAGYLVGGKTGSANISENGKAYDKKKHRSSFLSAYPMDNPRYLIYITLDQPKGNENTHGFSTGGWTSAEITKNITRRINIISARLPIDESKPEVRSAMAIKIRSKPLAA